MPIRPVVAYNNSPTYNIAKWLNSYLKNTIDVEFKYTIKNSIELANKIKEVKIPPNSLLVSLDVTNLFTNVPLEETKTIVRQKLIDSNLSHNIISEIMSLLTVCLEQNFFIFDKVTYYQPDGLAMGSPLSPLLADLFLDNFENQLILNNNIFHEHIIYYFRYVDDIIILWNDTLENLHLFLDYINSLHNKIKFKLEVENN